MTSTGSMPRPTGLDSQARRETWDLIEAVRDSGVTILLVTHFMDEAQRLCDRVIIVDDGRIIIDDGRIIAEGTPTGLAGQGRTAVIFRMRLPQPLDAALLSDLPSVVAMRGVDSGLEITGGPTVLPDVINRPALPRHRAGPLPDAVPGRPVDARPIDAGRGREGRDLHPARHRLTAAHSAGRSDHARRLLLATDIEW